MVVLFTGLMGWSVHVESMVFATGSFFALIVSVGLMNLYWLPHILERRHLEESARNAIAARMARAEERRHAWMGMILGLVFGGLGLGFAFWMFGQV